MPQPQHAIELPWPRDGVERAAAFLFGAAECAWLDGSNATDGVSLIARQPSRTLAQPRGDAARLVDAATGRELDREPSFWKLLASAAAADAQGSPPADRPARFGPGWVGYCGFELADQIESLPAAATDPLDLPLGRWSYFPAIILLDHARREASAIGATRDAAEQVRAAWLAAETSNNGAPGRAAAPLHARWRESIDAATFQGWVEHARAYIAAGDIYQVNLAHRVALEHLAPPMEAFHALRRHNPAPYAALLQWADGAVISASPELFIEKRGERVRTRPIKGTRPRRGDGPDDPGRRELLQSTKEAAELAMIVDLHRNDLGRVCKPASVRVVDPRRIEAHPHLWHTVAEIAGELPPDCSAVELLRNMFPAGSVSGVPKIRALQIIRELESSPRGAYTGALGWIGDNGDMIVNVAIRTLQVRGERGALHLGSGIVIDSDPAAEYRETLAKGRGILRALGVDHVAVSGDKCQVSGGKARDARILPDT